MHCIYIFSVCICIILYIHVLYGCTVAYIICLCVGMCVQMYDGKQLTCSIVALVNFPPSILRDVLVSETSMLVLAIP